MILPTLTIIYLLKSFSVQIYCQVTEESKKEILDYHNEVRSKIALGTYLVKFDNSSAGPSSNMVKLVWDDKIAKSAQEYISHCPTGHSQGEYGENLFRVFSSKKLENKQRFVLTSAKAWEGEFETYGLHSNVMGPLEIGHATQVVWARTTNIGCGVSYCVNETEVAVACQYYPPGNYDKEDIFELGETCSNCPEGTFCEESTGLCAFPSNYTDDC